VKYLVAVLAAAVLAPVGARLWVNAAASNHIFTDLRLVPECRVAVVLGSRVYPNGRLSDLLEDRVLTAIRLYKAGKVKKLLMSGDNRVDHYNEPQRMRDYALSHGVPPKDVICDFAGRRTYDTIYRAKRIFGLKRFIVVSQRFHLYRAIFLANHLRVQAYGVPGKLTAGLSPRLREYPACCGALVDIYLRKPRPIEGKHERI